MNDENKTAENQEAETKTENGKVSFGTKVKTGVKNTCGKIKSGVKKHKGKIIAIGTGAAILTVGALKMLANAKGKSEIDPDAELEPGDWYPEEEETESEEASVEEEVPEE